MKRFRVDRCRPGEEIELPPGEARHASRSLRVESGDRILLFDGEGGEWEAEVLRVAGTRVFALPGEPRPAAPRRELVIATAVPKGSRLDWMVEKLAELGVSEILPVRFRRGVASIGDGKRARLERIAVAAAKQSGRAVLPRIAAEIPIADLAKRAGPSARVASPGAAATLAASGRPSMVIVGPEGGLTVEEEAALRTAGALPVSLGPGILRIETAAVAAAAVVSQL